MIPLRLTIPFAALTLSLTAFGRTLTVDDARAYAASHLGGTTRASVSPESLTLSYMSEDRQSGNPGFYVFSGDDSFVIVAGDTGMPRIFGYSNEGGFPADYSQLPPALKYWLNLYESEVADFYAGKKTCLSTRAGIADRKDIPAMIKTKWGQGDPFNCLLPIDKDAREKPLTGCVATAAAQIVAYHKYFKGDGSHTNVRTTLPTAWIDETTVDYSKLSFDWSKMPNNLNEYSSQAEKEEVGKLMLALGTAFDMNWGADSSGAYTQFSAFLLHYYFGYSKAVEYAFHDYYTQEEWEQLAYDQLADGNPLLFGASSTDGGGHSFVCDGYRVSNNMFHFNWGWSGSQDGWFLMADDDNYPESQGFLVNGRPPREGDKVGNHLGTRNYAEITLQKWMSDEDGYDYDPPIPFQYMACGNTSWAIYWGQGKSIVFPEIDVCDMDGNHIAYYNWTKPGVDVKYYADNYGYSMSCSDESQNKWGISNTGKNKGFDVELPLKEMAGGCYRVYPCGEVSIDGGETFSEHHHMRVYAGTPTHSVVVVPPEAANLESRDLGNCYKTLTPDEFVPLTGVELGSDIALPVEGTKQLEPTYSSKYASAKFVKYESSNPDVAEVSPLGLVKGKADGTVTITATACDGSEVKDSIKAVVGTGVSTGIETVADTELTVVAAGDYISVSGASSAIEVYTVSGQLIGRYESPDAKIIVKSTGIYLVKVGNRCLKVRL